MDNNGNNNEPIVLGELKKEKSSKPVFAIVVFVLILGSCFALPYIKSIVSDEFNLNDLLSRKKTTTTAQVVSSTTTTITPSTTTTTAIPTTTTSIADNLIALENETIIRSDNFSLSKISIVNNVLNYTVVTSSNIDFNQSNYYLEIYNENKSFLGKHKLSGSIQESEQSVSQDLSFFANANNYYLRLINQNNKEASGE